MESKKFDFRRYKDCLRDKAFDSINATRSNDGFFDDDYSYYSIMDPFLLDIEKIRNSKSFRRLFYKTHVFSFPDNIYVRNRGFHTEDVVSVATTIASVCGLNVNLAAAGAHGHDLGHMPFSHLGEEFMSDKLKMNFHHAIYGAIICGKIERNRQGLNLCKETLGAIINHSRANGELIISEELPQEYTVVMLADKIAYTFSDLNDVLLLGYLKKEFFPKEVFSLGQNQREMVMNCIYALCVESASKGKISFSCSDVAQTFKFIRDFMYKNVYYKLDRDGIREEQISYLDGVFSGLLKIGLDKIQALTFISLMTDLEIKFLFLRFSGDENDFPGINEIKKMIPIDIFDNPPFHKEEDFCEY